jgi:hypothetical protein
MSQAFMRESDDQWLEDIGPSVTSLIVFLTRENNGHPVTERSIHRNSEGKQIHVMSNGLSYAKDEFGKWHIA